MTAGVVFHKRQGDDTMSIDQHIEELRAELRNAVYADERRCIEGELAAAIAERDAILATWAEEPPQ
jgi:hypothetical protein